MILQLLPDTAPPEEMGMRTPKEFSDEKEEEHLILLDKKARTITCTK